MKKLVIETVDKRDQTPNSYVYTLEPNLINFKEVLINQHNNEHEFVATYKIVDEESLQRYN